MSRKYKLRWQGQCGKYAVTKKRTVMQGPVTLKGGEAGLIFCLTVVLVLRLAHTRFLKKEAMVDALTQINDRLGFDEELKRCLKGQEDGKFTLVMVDVDDFKLFNDLYGHQIGDNVLKAGGPGA